MKIKTPAQITDQKDTISSDVIKHIQAITDDVRTILSGGLSFKDKQLPFQIQTINVINNQPTLISMQSPFSLVGVIPIATGNATISSFSTSSTNGKFNITLNMNINSAPVTFLLIGQTT